MEVKGTSHLQDDIIGGGVSSHKVFHNGVGDGGMEHSRKSSSESGSGVEGVGGSEGQGSEQEDNEGGVEGEGNSNQPPPELTVR